MDGLYVQDHHILCLSPSSGEMLHWNNELPIAAVAAVVDLNFAVDWTENGRSVVPSKVIAATIDLVVFVGIVDLIGAVFVKALVDFVKHVDKLESVGKAVFKILLEMASLLNLKMQNL